MGGVTDQINGLLRRVPAASVYVLGSLPALVYLRLGFANRLGADPVKVLEHEFGLISLQFLIAALMVTPLREVLGLSFLKFRRSLGLMAFFYACLHVLVWLILDRQLDWLRILGDVSKRPYIIVGLAAYLLLIPLALTSSDRAIRRLGAALWCRLHRLAYAATAFAAVHFIWLVKAWPPEPLAYGFAVLLLLSYRAFRRPLLAWLRPARRLSRAR